LEISFGDVDSTWGQYGLEQYPILIGGEDVPYKAIFRHGRLVRVLGSDYYLFPNEEALKIGDAAARLAGLEPFSPSAPGLRAEGHVLMNREETRMRAVYTLGRAHRVDGDEVNVGVNVFNAIDGTSSFGCGLFTYRFICGNGVIMGKENLLSVRRVHTRGLERAVEELKARMVVVMEEGAGLVEGYRAMARMRVTEGLVERILGSRLPLRVLPDYVVEEGAAVPDVSVWQLYNDVTEAIWHNARAGLRTKTFLFSQLHRVMPLQVRNT